MTLARRVADEVARNHGRDPWKIAGRLNLRVRRVDMPAPHRELYAQRHSGRKLAGLAISKKLSPVEERELLAHGIAHHLMHAGDRVTGTSRAVWSGRHEREANEFAALLLVPPHRLKALTATTQQGQAAEIAESCEVTESLARRRLRLG